MRPRYFIWTLAVVCSVPFIWAADTLILSEKPAQITKTAEQRLTTRISTLAAQKQAITEQIIVALDTIKAIAVDANSMVEESQAIIAETKAVLSEQNRTLENKAAIIEMTTNAVDVNDVESKACWVSFLTAVIEIAQQDLTK